MYTPVYFECSADNRYPKASAEFYLSVREPRPFLMPLCVVFLIPYWFCIYEKKYAYIFSLAFWYRQKWEKNGLYFSRFVKYGKLREEKRSIFFSLLVNNQMRENDHWNLFSNMWIFKTTRKSVTLSLTDRLRSAPRKAPAAVKPQHTTPRKAPAARPRA